MNNYEAICMYYAIVWQVFQQPQYMGRLHSWGEGVWETKEDGGLMIVFRRLLRTSESITELYIIGYIIIFHWLKSYVRACPHYWADEDLRESDKAFLTGVSLEITKSVPLTVNLSYFIFTGENNVNYLYFTISDPSSAVLSTCRNLLIFTLNPAWKRSHIY